MKAILRSINNFSCKLKQSNNLKYNISPKIRSNKLKNISGNGNVVIEDAIDKNAKDYKIYGNTYQNSTSGKNLFEGLPNTSGGLTSTINDDGSITYSGIATSTWADITARKYMDIESGTYTFSINKILTYRVTIRIFFEDNTYVNKIISPGNKFVVFTLDKKAIRYYAYISNFLTVGDEYNETLYIQLEKGNVATSYEPYTGGQPSPNPDYPQEMVSCGDNSTGLPVGYTQVDYIESSGAQYIDTGIAPNPNMNIKYKTLAQVGTLLGVNKGDYQYTIVGSNYEYFRIFSTNGQTLNSLISYNNTEVYEAEIRPTKLIYNNSEYSFSNQKIETYINSIYLFCRNLDGVPSNFGTRKLYYFKIYDNNVLVRDFVPCYRNSDNEVGLYDLVNDVFYTNQGTGVFTYGSEIEKGGYKIPVNVRSENLFDKDNANVYGGYLSGTGVVSGNGNPSNYDNIVYIECKPNTAYVLKKMLQSDTANNRFRVGCTSEIPVQGIQTTNFFKYGTTETQCVYTTSSTAKYLLFYCGKNSNTTSKQQILDSIMIVEGSIAPSKYIPYYNETTNIYLDEPLRKIDEYSDYIDFINGKVVRNIDEIILNGSEAWQKNSSFANVYFAENIVSNRNTTVSNLMSNSFIYGGTITTSRNVEKGKCYLWGNVGYEGRIVIGIEKETLNDLITWLSNNNVTVDYVLSTPTEEDIELPNINLIEGKNIITLGTELQGIFDVQYYSKEIIDISDYKYNLRKVED